MTEATSAPSTDRVEVPEEQVILAAPEGVSLTETARIADIATQIAHSSEGPQRRAIPLWVVVVALIGGASITLSAQAVMRRPTRATTAPTPAPATATQPLRIRTSPIVVPTTLAAPVVALIPESRPTTTRMLHSVATAEGSRRGRSKRLPPYQSPESRAGKPSPAVKWVDPFATKRSPMLTTTTARKAPTNAPTRTRWVDPFAN